jgi:hypothetical protein
MPGYRMIGADMDAADLPIVRFRALRSMPENTNRVENCSYTHKSFASSLCKKLSFSGGLGAGVPDIFDFESSASYKSGVLASNEKIEIHFQQSQQIPKAKAVFAKEDISLDDAFIKKVEAIRP